MSQIKIIFVFVIDASAEKMAWLDVSANGDKKFFILPGHIK